MTPATRAYLRVVADSTLWPEALVSVKAADLLELLDATEWSPIKTAPADGSRILVAGGVISKRAENIRLVLADGDWWRKHIGESPSIPTHWRPLPDPPATGNDDAG